jgi:hypothetical protein
MAIYDHQYGDLSYFRVFRAWGGQEYQEYVRIKRSRNAAYKKAQEIDARLAKAQKAFMIEQALSPSYHIRANGQIRGLRRVRVSRKGRSLIEVFELRINVPWRDEIKRTTLSIAVHGEHKAFLLALEIIYECYAIKPKSPLALALQACFSAYTSADKKAAANTKADKPSDSRKTEVAVLNKRPELVSTTPVEQVVATETQMDDFSEVSAVKDLVFKKARHEFVNLTDGLFKGLRRFTA